MDGGGLTLIAIVFLMGMYYKKYEIQKRFSVIFTSGLVAGAFGGVGSAAPPA